MQSALTVHDWPTSVNQLKLDEGLLVIALRTSAKTSRPEARLQIRETLHKVLAMLLKCDVGEVQLLSQQGKPLTLLNPALNIGLSISHEIGLSLAAINMNGAVGIDLMSLNNMPALNEIHSLATDYLGSTIAQQLASLSANLQTNAFAKAWTAFESRLKCGDIALTEWNEAAEIHLAQYTYKDLMLPDGYIGTVAF